MFWAKIIAYKTLMETISCVQKAYHFQFFIFVIHDKPKPREVEERLEF